MSYRKDLGKDILRVSAEEWHPPLTDPSTFPTGRPASWKSYTSLFVTLENQWLCPEPHMTSDHALWSASESLGYVKVDSEPKLELLQKHNSAYQNVGLNVALLANSPLTNTCTHKHVENGQERTCRINRRNHYPSIHASLRWMGDVENPEEKKHLRSQVSSINYRNRSKRAGNRPIPNAGTWACIGCSVSPGETVSVDWAQDAHTKNRREKAADQYMTVDMGSLGYRICWINRFERRDQEDKGLDCENQNWGGGPWKDNGACKFRYGTIPSFDTSGNLAWPVQHQPKENAQSRLVEVRCQDGELVSNIGQEQRTEAIAAGPSGTSSMPAVTTSMPADPGAHTTKGHYRPW